jgi:type IV pilus assembly protein PilA
MKPDHRGFTIIEMMIVLAIIGILALMMAPTYQDKIVRDEIVAALPLADLAKTRIAATWAMMQMLPQDNEASGLPPAEKIVSNHIRATLVQNGAIHVTFGNNANGLIAGKTLSIRPAIVTDAPVVPIAWVCGNAAVPEKMTARGENRTDIPPNLLPFNCRARNTKG